MSSCSSLGSCSASVSHLNFRRSVFFIAGLVVKVGLEGPCELGSHNAILHAGAAPCRSGTNAYKCGARGPYATRYVHSTTESAVLARCAPAVGGQADKGVLYAPVSNCKRPGHAFPHIASATAPFNDSSSPVSEQIWVKRYFCQAAQLSCTCLLTIPKE